MTEQNTKGPAAAWTGAVDRCELASKALASSIKLWDECGSVPKLEDLAWQTAEAARAALTYAQEAEKKAFKRLKEAQAQLDIPGTSPDRDENPSPDDLMNHDYPSISEPIKDNLAQAPDLALVDSFAVDSEQGGS